MLKGLPNKISEFPKVSIFRAKDMGRRVWGQELLLGLLPGDKCDDGVAIKLIQMNPGKSGRFQIHHLRDEIGYLLDGAMLLRVGQHDGTIETHLLEPGDCYHFPAGLPHQEEALIFSRVLELSPAYGNDRKGMEAEYGLPVPDAESLPSTTVEQITKLEQWWSDGANYKNGRKT